MAVRSWGNWTLDPTVTSAVGGFGDAAAIALFLSPIPTMTTIVKARSVQSFALSPFTSAWLNCFIWTLYALPLITSDRTTPLICNSVGLVLETFYMLIYVIFSPAKARLKRALTVGGFVGVGIVAAVVMLVIHPLPVGSYTSGLGIVATVVNIIST